MSRTNKTDPLWVRMIQGTVYPYPVHDHSEGECDLIPLEGLPKDWWRIASRCYWDFDSRGKGVCACNLCRGKGWNDSQDPRIQRKKFKSKTRSTDFDNV